MILEEEYKEALGSRLVLAMALGGSSGAAVSLLDAVIDTGRGAVWFSASAVVAMICVVCVVRYQRIIKAWRDQKRLELAQRELEKMGGEG